MIIIKFINKITGQVIEEHISGCACKSKYAKDPDYIKLSSISDSKAHELLKLNKDYIFSLN